MEVVCGKGVSVCGERGRGWCMDVVCGKDVSVCVWGEGVGGEWMWYML